MSNRQRSDASGSSKLPPARREPSELGPPAPGSDSEIAGKPNTQLNMKRKQRSRKDTTPTPQPTPSYPPPRALLENHAAIRATVVACGVPAHEVDDVTATCVMAAWAAIQRGDFRVHAWVDPAEALRRWLYGVTWRLSSHERTRAHHRREVLAEDPWALSPEPPMVDVESQLGARAGLRALRALDPKQRALLLAVAAGESTAELAGPLGVTTRAVLQQIARAREKLQQRIDEGDPP